MSDKPPVPTWLRPVWVRAIFVIFPLVWAMFEFWRGDAIWGALFIAAAIWGGYTLFYTFSDPDQRD
jgi:hypothetical protein